MGIVVLLLFVVIACVIVGVMRYYDKSWGAAIPTAALIIIIGVFVSSATLVPTGHTGIITAFGKVENETLDSGLHFVGFWKNVVDMDNRTQIATLELSCFSSDIQEVIKENFPDIFENEPSFKVATDICDIIRCDDRDCMSCYLNRAGIDKPYELQEYKGSSNSKSSN